MAHNYDTVAKFYDPFSRLVFGNTQVRAQQFLLQFIPAGAHILIAGGGTGWILEDIARLHLSGLTITYIDSSEKMITIARQRHVGNNNVTFITGNAQEVTTDHKCDVVITPFLFDNFTEDGAQQLFTAIDSQLNPQGLWLCCDFNNTNRASHKVLLKLMYLFFRVCCGISARSMPEIPVLFRENRYSVVQQLGFMNGFISSAVYKKP